MDKGSQTLYVTNRHCKSRGFAIHLDGKLHTGVVVTVGDTAIFLLHGNRNA
jgi:hypothetical protein